MKTRLFILMSLALFFSLSGCNFNEHRNIKSKSDKEGESAQLEKLNFRLKWVIYSSFASHFVAEDSGYYKDVGLKVNILPGGPGFDPIRLVASGADDVGLAGYEQILMARENGIPLVAIGEDYIRSGVGFFSLKETGILKPQDFINHKVGIQAGTDKYYLYMALMNKLKIDRSKITEIPVAFDLSLLFNKTVDVFPGFITNQPFVAEERGMPVNIVDPYEYGIRPGGNVYFTSEETLLKKRKELKAFLKATMKGIIMSQQIKDEDVVDIVMKYNKELDRKAELKIWKSTKDVLLEKDTNKVGYLYLDKWNYTANIAKEYGLIKEIPDISRCYTNELVEEIHREGFLK